MISQLLFFLHIVISIALIGLILLQQSQGADVSANFGGGSQTLFGSRGSASFLSKVTGILMGLFFLTSLALGHVMGHAHSLKTTLSLNKIEHHNTPSSAA